MFQLVVSAVLYIDIVSYKCCIVSDSSIMCWDLLLVMLYFDYVLKENTMLYDTDVSKKSQDGLRMKYVSNIPVD